MALRSILGTLAVALVSVSFSSCPLEGPSGTDSVPGNALLGSPAGPALSAERASPRPSASSHQVLELERETPGIWPESTLTEPSDFGTDGAARWPDDSVGQAVALTVGESRRVSIDPDRALVALAKETLVFARPDWRAERIGFLRAGAVVEREPEPSGHAACPEGWYRIEPEGFVCVGKTASLDLGHPIVAALERRPNRAAALPYVYGLSRSIPPELYTRVPRPEEQRRYEPDLEQNPRLAHGGAWGFVPLEAAPAFALGGSALPQLLGFPPPIDALSRGRALTKSGFAFLRFFQVDGRQFGVTVDLSVLALDRLTPVRASKFHGLELDREHGLPVAFVLTKGAWLLAGDPRTQGMRTERTLGYREALHLTGQAVWKGNVNYLETRDGYWLRADQVVRIDPMQNRPSWASPGRTWIDVSILRQSLIAYEGVDPVYVTLVSTGIDGIGDPKQTKSTIRGQFLIHTKHVSTTMDGDQVGDEFDLRDVPYVQYFTAGYALHAAYWHDGFGRPRSHGCINLSPLDAHWLFEWTDPPVPEAWHVGLSLRGTLIHIHP
jgi:hypothetical protein